MFVPKFGMLKEVDIHELWKLEQFFLLGLPNKGKVENPYLFMVVNG